MGAMMDGRMMADCPMKLEFDGLQPTRRNDFVSGGQVHFGNYDKGYDFKPWCCSDQKDCEFLSS